MTKDTKNFLYKALVTVQITAIGNGYSTRGFVLYFMRRIRLGYGLLLASLLLSLLGYLSWSQGLITFLPGLLLIYVHKK